MRYIRFYLSDKSEITVDEPQALEILRSQQQLIPIKKDGKWTGEMINKAFIVRSIPDRDEMDYQGMKNPDRNLKIEAGPYVPINLSEYKPDSLKTLTEKFKA